MPQTDRKWFSRGRRRVVRCERQPGAPEGPPRRPKPRRKQLRTPVDHFPPQPPGYHRGERKAKEKRKQGDGIPRGGRQNGSYGFRPGKTGRERAVSERVAMLRPSELLKGWSNHPRAVRVPAGSSGAPISPDFGVGEQENANSDGLDHQTHLVKQTVSPAGQPPTAARERESDSGRPRDLAVRTLPEAAGGTPLRLAARRRPGR